MLESYDICLEKFSEYGLNLTEDQYSKFDSYAEFLVEYNNKVNLTAITKPRDILVKHFIDSILLCKYVDIPKNSTIIDVGTGAGFPSIPLKIYRSDLKIALLDSLNKRIIFLQELCKIINVPCETIHGRAENISKIVEYREKFDIACARAVANLTLLSELCIPFVKMNGSFISMKGPSEDISLGYNAIKILGGSEINEINYDLDNEHRRILISKKISHTPTKYPRNSSQIKRKLL